MDNKLAIIIRAKKIGILIRDARLAASRNKKELGEAIGVSSATVGSIESGRKSPSLPDLEMLAYSLKIPLEHFWTEEIISDDPSLSESIHIEHALSLRDRSIGNIVQTKRNNLNMSYKDIKEQTGISAARMKKYESGDRPIPLPELEILANLFNLNLREFTDPESAAGKWITEQRSIDGFKKMSPEMQKFVSTPVNVPFIELARKLSALSTNELRDVAEGLLEITI